MKMEADKIEVLDNKDLLKWDDDKTEDDNIKEMENGIRWPLKSFVKLHIEEAEKALQAAEHLVNLAEKHPEKRGDLLRAGSICIMKVKQQLTMSRLYKDSQDRFLYAFG
jgi:hypothetical protein